VLLMQRRHKTLVLDCLVRNGSAQVTVYATSELETPGSRHKTPDLDCLMRNEPAQTNSLRYLRARDSLAKFLSLVQDGLATSSY